MQLAREDNETVTEIQVSILDYLAEHPQAADSVEGIRNWWLLRRIARYSLTRVQQALDYLERADLVQRTVLQDGGILYRRIAGACPDRAGAFTTANHRVNNNSKPQET